MNLPQFALSHRPVVLAFALVFIGMGLFNFLTMSRREDPEITVRIAVVDAEWPGAPARKVEELITNHLEEAIAEIPEVKLTRSRSLVGRSLIHVELDETVSDTDQLWDDLRTKVRSAQSRLPQGSLPPEVFSDYGDVYAVAFALYQIAAPGQERIRRPYSARELEVFAEGIQDQLEIIGSVARVDLWGVQPEQIFVEVDSADWAKINLTASQLKGIFEARNIVEPGGELNTARGRYAVNPTGEFTSVDQMNDLIVARVDGNLPVRLGNLPLTIDRRYAEPPESLTRFSSPQRSHRPALVLGVSMKSGQNITQMSRAITATMKRLRRTVLPPDLEVTLINDLPKQVSDKIGEFRDNLLQGVLLVLLVAFVLMGWRSALIMATAVPLSMVSAFALVRFFGVQLEQISVASLIIALGMVVDNAIVVSDNTLRLMDEGTPKREAVVRGAQDLAIPLLTSTLTTMFAFLPMVTMSGNSGEYVRSLPIVVAATLGSSLLVALFVTPIMCGWLLEPPASNNISETRETPKPNFFYDRFMKGCLEHKGLSLGSIALVFVVSFFLLPLIGTQFFPAGFRDQFYIKVWLPEGSPISKTSDIASQVERVVLDSSPISRSGRTQERLKNIVSFIGTGGPRLMLNQGVESHYPYLAFLLVNTTNPDYTAGYLRETRKKLANLPGARISVEPYVFGPPVYDPVAFRLSGPNHEILQRKAREMIEIFKTTPGTKDTYSDWGAPGYQVEVRIDPYAANMAGVTNSDVALTTKSLLSGARLTTYREGDHRVPVMLRTLRESRQGVDDLSGIFVSGKFGKVPLESVAKIVPTWEPAVIRHRNNLPTVQVAAQVQGGVLPNAVAARIKPRLEAMMQSLPPEYRLHEGGEQEETADSQTKVSNAMTIALVLILLVLVVQYNSLLKPLVILFTLPLAFTGALVGLYVTGWAMGFMAMLGILALVGIVINNAIVLIDFIEKRVAAGENLRSAVTVAARLRARPIILTSLTTIGGLLPLSLFGGPLWAPMTNGMIFGLLFSTVLTLVVIPTMYVVFAERLKMKVV